MDAGFAEGGEGFNSFSKMGARLCSAPVLCAQDMSGMDDGEQDEADEMTHRAFKHYVNTLAQVPITTSEYLLYTIETRVTKKTFRYMTQAVKMTYFLTEAAWEDDSVSRDERVTQLNSTHP